MAKKLTPEQEKEQQRDAVVQHFLKTVENSLVQNIGNRLSTELATGVLTHINAATGQMLEGLKHVDGQ